MLLLLLLPVVVVVVAVCRLTSDMATAEQPQQCARRVDGQGGSYSPDERLLVQNDARTTCEKSVCACVCL